MLLKLLKMTPGKSTKNAPTPQVLVEPDSEGQAIWEGLGYVADEEVEIEPVPEEVGKRAEMLGTDLSRLDKKGLALFAAQHDLEIDERWSLARLRKEIEKALQSR